MEKNVFIDERADKELHSFSIEIQKRFKTLITALGEKGRLEAPDGKKLDNELFEIRISHDTDTYRGLYAYV